MPIYIGPYQTKTQQEEKVKQTIYRAVHNSGATLRNLPILSLSSIVITWGHVSGHIMITRFGTCDVIIGDYFLLF